MAFLGDFGKFFGLGSSKEVLGSAGAATAGYFGLPPSLGQGLGEGLGSATSNLSGTGDQPNEQSALPAPPARRPADLGAQEFQGSGNMITRGNMPSMQSQAGFGNLLPLLTSGVSRFLGSKGGQLGTSIATGVGASALLGGGESRERPVLTQSRRNKARVRQLVNFMGIEGAANFLGQNSGQNVSPNDVVMLLLRTFRNDGAFITKAQVRNLRRTTNRFKSLEKQVKEATSMSRTTRKSPVRRSSSSTTLIRN
jgi:hypothetical protein|tara:strand:+ start:390 stop:1148 length:759 start_codon:yes stop_codon:yes gene_type:complete